MPVFGKKATEANRMSYYSVSTPKPHVPKINTQSIQSPHLLTTHNFRDQSRDKIKTSYVADKNKGSCGIFMRKIKKYQSGLQHGIRSPMHVKFIGNEPKPTYQALAQSSTQRETQREKFIKELNLKVLGSENTSFIQNEQNQHTKQRVIVTNRYDKDSPRSKNRSVAAKSILSVGDITDRPQIKPLRDSCEVSLKPVKSMQEEEIVVRSRSRTFGKDFSKIVEQNLNFKNKIHRDDYCRTIEANNLESKMKLSQSLDQIQKFDRMRGNNNGPAVQGRPDRQMTKSDQLAQVETNGSAVYEGASEGSGYFLDRNTEVYEEEVQVLTNDFLAEWDRMNSVKSQLYQKFRNKLVKEYPSMRKRYKQRELYPAESADKTKRNSSVMMSPALQSSIRMSLKNKESSQSAGNYLTVTQVRDQSQKIESEGTKQTLKEIFKQAYFWSRTKGKSFNVKYRSGEEVEEQKQIRNIQKNMTFMSYIKKKEGRTTITKKTNMKCNHIIKNKEQILQIQKEGSPQQGFLKKCLDDAIEGCLH